MRAHRYEGELVEIVTANGRKLAGTPKKITRYSPPQGWVALGLLQEGDDVVSHGGAERVPALVDPHDEQVPTRIEDVASALGRRGPVLAITVPGAPVDFHGDGMVRLCRGCRCRTPAEGPALRPASVRAYHQTLLIPAPGVALHSRCLSRPRRDSTELGTPRLAAWAAAALAAALGGTECGGMQVCGCANAATLDTSRDQALADRPTIDAEPLCCRRRSPSRQRGRRVHRRAISIPVRANGWRRCAQPGGPISGHGPRQ